jgi:biotin carboxyl carrier protein
MWYTAALAARAEEGAMATRVEAQISGTVFRIEKREGEGFAAGDVILLLESMKMESRVESSCGGTLVSIRVDEKESVEEGAVLAVIE